jgi:hypothetical protein
MVGEIIHRLRDLLIAALVVAGNAVHLGIPLRVGQSFVGARTLAPSRSQPSLSCATNPHPPSSGPRLSASIPADARFTVCKEYCLCIIFQSDLQTLYSNYAR